jgi:hypothetical protein
MSIFTKGLQLYTQARKSRGLMQNWLIRPKTASASSLADHHPTALYAHTSTNAVREGNTEGSKDLDCERNVSTNTISAVHATLDQSLEISRAEVCSESQMNTELSVKDQHDPCAESGSASQTNKATAHYLQENNDFSMDKKASTAHMSADHVIHASKQAGSSPAASGHQAVWSPKFSKSGNGNCTAREVSRHDVPLDCPRSALKPCAHDTTKPHAYDSEYTSHNLHDISASKGSDCHQNCDIPTDSKHTAAQQSTRDNQMHGISACAHTHGHDVIDLTSTDPPERGDNIMKDGLKNTHSGSHCSDIPRNSSPTEASSTRLLGKRGLDTGLNRDVSTSSGGVKQPRSALGCQNVAGKVAQNEPVEEEGH